MANNIDKIQVGSTNYNITPSSEGTFTGTSYDAQNSSSWISVTTLVSGETNGSIFTKISQMFRNIRYLYKVIGSANISAVGTNITNAINNLNSNKSSTSHTHSTFTSAANGFVPAAKNDTTNYATTGYVLTGAGWKFGIKYNTDTTYSYSTTNAPGLMPELNDDNTYYLNGTGNWSVPSDTNTTYSVVTTTTPGLMPKLNNNAGYYMNGTGNWSVPPDTNTTYAAVSASANGLMTSALFNKLNSLATRATITGFECYQLANGRYLIFGSKNVTLNITNPYGNAFYSQFSINLAGLNVPNGLYCCSVQCTTNSGGLFSCSLIDFARDIINGFVYSPSSANNKTLTLSVVAVGW